jgi:hypothetical protein
MDSDDLEFAQFAADAFGLTNQEYVDLIQEFGTPEWQEAATEEEEEDEEWREFYSLAGPWDDWMEADSWYELTCSYEEHG